MYYRNIKDMMINNNDDICDKLNNKEKKIDYKMKKLNILQC